MGWILHSWICAFPDLAQALRGLLRGSYRITRTYSHHHNIDCIIQQVMQQHALDIAKTYSDPSWSTAAQNLRAPYWDWATNIIPPDEVISQESVSIITPDGNTTDVPNPLFQYTFNPIDPSFPAPYSSWKTTIRHPDDPNSPSATTDIQALVEYASFLFPNSNLSFGFLRFLSSSQNDITSSIYNVLTRVRTWPAFSNHTAGDGGSSSNSLEAVHDEIHVLVAGDMGDPAVAGKLFRVSEFLGDA